MLKRFRWFPGMGLLRNKKGFTLTEVVIAIAVLGLVVASIPAAMIVVSKMQARQDERRVSEYLTRSQLEYIKSQPYNWGNVTGDCSRPCCSSELICYDTVQGIEDYYVVPSAVPVYFDDFSHTYQALPPGQDQGIQEIIIEVRSPGKTAPVLVTTNYKVALGE